MRKRVYAGTTFVAKRFISAPFTRSVGPPCSHARTHCALAFAAPKTPAKSVFSGNYLDDSMRRPREVFYPLIRKRSLWQIYMMQRRGYIAAQHFP
jgi:hypothetical protein